MSSRRTLPNRAAYALAAVVIGLGLFASLTPSSLYHTYSELWHFSPLTLTLIYATYAFGVLATLILAGRVPRSSSADTPEPSWRCSRASTKGNRSRSGR